MFTLVSKNLLSSGLDLDYYNEMLSYFASSTYTVSDDFLKNVINDDILLRELNSNHTDILPVIQDLKPVMNHWDESSVVFVFNYNNIYVRDYPTLLTVLTFSKWLKIMADHGDHTLGDLYDDNEKCVTLLTVWLSMNDITYYLHLRET